MSRNYKMIGNADYYRKTPQVNLAFKKMPTKYIKCLLNIFIYLYRINKSQSIFIMLIHAQCTTNKY